MHQQPRLMIIQKQTPLFLSMKQILKFILLQFLKDSDVNIILQKYMSIIINITCQIITSMSTGDLYQGQYKQGWFHGNGKLTMENGVIYQGQFVKGHFHGQGKLIYPNGGHYRALWQQGKMISGDYIFADNLQFQTSNWQHCQIKDRRFYQQSLNGIRPSGSTQQTKQQSPHHIPPGTYDAGDGYYQPVKSIIYNFKTHQIIRTPSEQEVKFIMSKCRYVPKLVQIDGHKDSMIRKVVQKEKQADSKGKAENQLKK